MSRPKIGIIANKLYEKDDILPYVMRAYVSQEYVDAVLLAGGIPVLIPVIDDTDAISCQLDGLDGVIFSGGYDIDPSLYGQQPHQRLGLVMSDIDNYYIKAINTAVSLHIPILGICKGMQALNVAFGGTLYQDITTQVPNCIQHTQKGLRGVASHSIDITSNSFIASVLGTTSRVNSHHHQAVDRVGSGFEVVARASDGIVEAIEYNDSKVPIIGVQWHPEMMAVAGSESMVELLHKFFTLCS